MKSIVMVVGLILAGCAGAATESPRVTPGEARHLIESDSSVIVLDVRTQAEYDGPLGHLAKARLIPVQELEQRVNELEPFRSQTIVVYCRTGGRSTRASATLKGKGFRVLNMDGGITRWNSEHLPVVMEQAGVTNPK